MGGKELAICFAAAVVLFGGLFAAREMYFHRKSPDEKQAAIKKMQDQTDKALEGTDDPNEMARWVP